MSERGRIVWPEGASTKTLSHSLGVTDELGKQIDDLMRTARNLKDAVILLDNYGLTDNEFAAGMFALGYRRGQVER